VGGNLCLPLLATFIASDVGRAAEVIGPSARTTGLVISEIMYHPPIRTDEKVLEYIELYNCEPVAKDLSGFRLSGEVDFTFAQGVSIPALDYAVIAYDPASMESVYGLTNVHGPYAGKLDNNLGRIRLRNQLDAVLLEVNYEDEAPWPLATDGAGHSLILSAPSYGENDVRAWSASAYTGGSPGYSNALLASDLLINEFAAHTDLNDTNYPDHISNDWIELFNSSTSSIVVSNYYLSDDPAALDKWPIPPTNLPPGGFAAYDEVTGFHNPTNIGFGLSKDGEQILLSCLPGTAADRVVDAVRYRAQENGIVSGRFPDGAPDFHELEVPTRGATNAALHIRDIVINEIMYNPISGSDDDEYVEIHNGGTNSVDLTYWRFIDGIGFSFPSNTIIQPGSNLVIAANATNLIAGHPLLNAANTLGNFSGRLANSGEKIVLARPEDPLFPSQGFLVVDEVAYSDGGLWGEWADGGGSSLELIDPRSDNRRAYNWADSDESGKSAWTTITNSGVLDNGSGANNEIQIMLLGRGECLIDSILVSQVGQTNIVPNPGFEAGTNDWTIQGNHIDSNIETNDSHSGINSFRIVASGAGDNSVNRIEADLAVDLPDNSNATISAHAKWVHGVPLVLLRLHGNRLEAAGELTTPDNLGTPGQPNSQPATNAAPAIWDVSHNPILPEAGEAVVVSCRAHDPDGLGGVQCIYRIDPGGGDVALDMNDAGTGGDAVPSDGLYSGRIPAQLDETLLAFHIRAWDAHSTSTTNTFPPTAPDRECLVLFGEALEAGAFGSYRLWMRDADVTTWEERQKLSNHALPTTFVYGNKRVSYLAGVRYRGSPFIRPNYEGPEESICAFIVSLDKGEPLCGSTRLNLDTLEPWKDGTRIRERMSFWIGEQLRIPFCHQRYIHLYFNESKRGDIYCDVLQPGAAEYLSCWFPGNDKADFFKIDDWFEFNDDDQVGREFNINATLGDFTTTGGAKKQARYRWNWEKKNTGKLDDDYSMLFDLVDVMNLPDMHEYTAAIGAIADVSEWLRTFVARHIVSDWDGYGYSRGKNQFAYKPESEPWQMLLWDLDFSLGSGSATNADLYMSNDGLIFNRMYAHPPFERVFLDIYREAALGPMLATNFNPHAETWSAALISNGVPSDSVAPVEDWVQGRRSYILSQIPSVDFEITSNGGADFNTNASPAALSGTAPVEARYICVNSNFYPITWVSVTNWTIQVPLGAETNTLLFEGLSSSYESVTGAQDSITVTFTGSSESPVGNLVINEIMYHPAQPGTEFVEVYNRSASSTFDLSEWLLRGVSFSFPPGTTIGPGEYLVVVDDEGAFHDAFGAITVAGEYGGSLDNGGETVRLVIPGGTQAEDIVVNELRYDDDPPWPTRADGAGPSLQLIDSFQDNRRIGNWGIDTNFLATPKALNSISQSLSHFPNVWINEIQPQNVNGIQDGAGDRDPWIELINAGNNPPSTSAVTLVEFDSNWRYLDTGTNLGTAWRDPAFDDTTWSNGPAELGYGDGDESTVVSYGPNQNSKYTTTYFRRSFVATNVASLTNLTTHIVRDDGLVVYLNGAGIYTNNLPAGPIYYDTFANSVVGGVDESTPQVAPVDEGSLQEGTNVLAVEVHQFSLTSTDISFNFELTATRLQAGGAVSLANLYLTDNLTNFTKWAFPAGAQIAENEIRLVWTDGEPGETMSNEWHTSFLLPPLTGVIALAMTSGSSTMVLDCIDYDVVGADHSYGSVPDADPLSRSYLHEPSPGQTNTVTASTNSIYINEWLAAHDVLYDEDWFELHNPNSSTVDISGYTLTDDLTDPNKELIPAGAVVPPGGFLHVWADGSNDASGLPATLHVQFKLSAGGETIGLFAPNGSQVDALLFGPQNADVAEGRWPDSAAETYTLEVATPGSSNIIFTTNTPPVLSAIGGRTNDEELILFFTVEADDTNAPPQTLSFSLDPGAPTGASINPSTGAFSWTPNEVDGPGDHPITFRVTDDGDPLLSDTELVTISVAESNQAPHMSPITDCQRHAASLIEVTASASDLDYPTQAITYALDPGSPTGATVNPSTGLISWYADESATGVLFTFNVRATDDGVPALNDTNSFEVLVAAPLEFLSLSSSAPTGLCVDLTWSAIIGATYEVEYTHDLLTNDWTLLREIDAIENPSSIQDTNAPFDVPHRFYRIGWLQ